MKKFFAAIVSCFVVFLLIASGTSAAQSSDSAGLPVLSSSFVEKALGVHRSKGGDGSLIVSIFDYNGNDITGRFLAETNADFLASDYDAISAYCARNVQRVSTKTYIPATERNADATMRYEETFVETRYDANNFSLTVEYWVAGYLYYNSATLQISRASTPTRSYIFFSNYAGMLTNITYTHETGSASISSAGYYATASYSFRLKATSYYGESDFGTVSCNFRVQP